jgi:D-tyrosyl-tRNA(Tyr) deacylase
LRAVVQRVSRAAVQVEGDTVGSIEHGILALVGVARDDSDADADGLADKLCHLRIFADAEGKMNRSLLDVAGELLIVSQFTLLGDCRKGRRPSYGAAADPEPAARLVERLVAACGAHGVRVQTGQFRAHMQVDLSNDGPVTLLLDTHREF